MNQLHSNNHASSIFVGLDVHKKTTAIAAFEHDQFIFQKTVSTTDLKELRNVLKKLQKRGSVSVCYEACQAGFALQRAITDWGIPCAVVAPSLIPVKPGERKKCDRLDAQKLARYFAHGLLTAVHVPTADEEAARDLVRHRYTLQKDLTRAKHRVVKFLRKKGHDYTEGDNWTTLHRNWLDQVRLPNPYDQETLTSLRFDVETLELRLDRLDNRIQQIAETPPYKHRVAYLRGMRGIETLIAMVLVTELGDLRRFPNPRALMAYLGLVPGVHASGDTSRGGQTITKAGNKFCRHVLVQAAWCYARPPGVSKKLRVRQQDLPPWVKDHAMAAHDRLYKRFKHLEHTRSKQVAVIATARELAGFVGVLMLKCQLEEVGVGMELTTRIGEKPKRGRSKKARLVGPHPTPLEILGASSEQRQEPLRSFS